MEKPASFWTSEQILDQLVDPAIVIDEDFRVIYLNEAARDFFRIEGDALGAPCYGIFRRRDRPCHLDAEHCPVKEAIEKEEGVKIIRRSFNEKNEENVQEITAAPIRGQEGKIRSVLKIIRNLQGSDLFGKIETSERRYKNLATSSPNGAVIINGQGLVVECNPAVEKLFGWKPQDLIGRPVTVLIPERLRARHGKGLTRAVRDRIYKYSGKTLELNGWREDRQEEFPVTLSLSSWQEGEELFFSAIIVDGSHQHALENSLREEKKRIEETRANLKRQHSELKSLFKQVEKAKEEWERTMDCIGDMVMLVSHRDRILRCNKAVTEFCGLPYDQVLGKNWEDLLLGHGMETNFSRGKAIELFHRPTGKWFLLNIYDYGDKDAATRFVVTVHETTRLKHIADELTKRNNEIEENRKKLRLALDEISSLIEKVTTGQSVVRFEYPGGGNCWEVMKCQQKECPCYGQDSQRCWEETGSFCGGGLCQTGEGLKNCDQCPFYRLATADPIYQIGLQFNNMMEILERKNEELESAYTELKATQAQILQQEKMASIGQLAAGVAHELNNPLGFIASNLGTLQKYLDRLIQFIEAQATEIDAENADRVAEARRRLKIDYVMEDAVDLIKESLDGSDRLKKIIQDLKSFSRVDQAQFTHADITECLESTINIVWNELKYKATITKEYGELPLTKCYPQQLNQVFLNLLVNASQAIEKQGEIRITTWCENDFIFVTVADTGCGIPPENLKRLFEPFFTTKEVGKGTGLGLSITFDIIKRHQGEITVESEVDKGSAFTIKIPVVEGR